MDGVITIIPFHSAILSAPEFTAEHKEGFTVHTRWIDSHLEGLAEAARAEEVSRLPPPDEIASPFEDQLQPVETERPQYRAGVKAPLSGMIIELCVAEGDTVTEGDIVAILTPDPAEVAYPHPLREISDPQATRSVAP